MKLHSTSLNLALSAAATACCLFAQSATLGQTYTLPPTPLGPFQNSVLPDSIINDHGFKLGSIGSGLFRSFLEGPNVYWMVTDRGPNPMIGSTRTFPVPAWTPFLIKVRTTDTQIEILQKIPIRIPDGKTATGIPNLPVRDEVALPCDGDPTKATPFNQNGLDTEDLTRTLDGNFWLVEEHSTSIVKVSPNGVVAKRYLPQGLALPEAGYPISNTLPALFGSKRKQNRGFEGITLGWDLRTLYAALQSPLVNPTTAIGNASRNTRILAFDAYTEHPTAEFVYRFQPVTEFGGTNPADMKISAVAALDPWRLLVLERTDAVAKIYRVDLTKATNILGTKWDDVATTPSLEAINVDADLLAAGVKVLPKELIIDLSTIPGMPEKIEGMTILDWNTIAISNDNDFDVGPATCDANIGPGTVNKILTINLSKPLYF